MSAPKFEHITVATDGSAYGQQAVETAIDLAKKYGAQLEVVSVVPLTPVYVAAAEPWVPVEVAQAETSHYRSVLSAAVQKAEAEGLAAVTGILLEGVVIDELIAHVEHGPTDLLVLGSRGLSAAKRLFLGSVSDAVMHHLKVPVLLVRGPPS